MPNTGSIEIPYWMITADDHAKLVNLATQYPENSILQGMLIDFSNIFGDDPTYAEYFFAPKGAIDPDELEELDTCGITITSTAFRESMQPTSFLNL